MRYRRFPGFYKLLQHKNTQHDFSIKTANVDLGDIIKEVDDTNLKQELRSCQHGLEDSELEGARHKLFNYPVENLIATNVDEKLDHFFKCIKCAAEVNLVFGFILKKYKMEDSVTFTHSKTIPSWIEPNWCAPGLTWLSYKVISIKLT